MPELPTDWSAAVVGLGQMVSPPRWSGPARLQVTVHEAADRLGGALRSAPVRGAGSPGAEAGRKAAALVASAALLAAVVQPVRQNWRPAPQDGFPLSYYPMFSARRRRTGKVTHVVGTTDDGRERRVPHGHAGVGGMNQVRRQLRRAVADGSAPDVARDVAGEVGSCRRHPGCRETAVVHVVTGTYRYADLLRAGPLEPVRRVVHASLDVPARRPPGGPGTARAARTTDGGGET